MNFRCSKGVKTNDEKKFLFINPLDIHYNYNSQFIIMMIVLYYTPTWRKVVKHVCRMELEKFGIPPIYIAHTYVDCRNRYILYCSLWAQVEETD